MSPLRTWTQQLKLGFCVAYDNSGNGTQAEIAQSTTSQDFVTKLFNVLKVNNTNDFNNFQDFSLSEGIVYEVNKRMKTNINIAKKVYIIYKFIPDWRPYFRNSNWG